MKLNDAVWGALLLLFSVTLLVHVQSFPPMPGQRVGPALFPGLIAVGLAVCAVLLMVKDWAARSKQGGAPALMTLAPWTRSPRQMLAFGLVIGANVGYILLVDKVGFIPIGTLYLVILFWVLGVSPKWNLVIAIAVTLVIHYAFYKLLRVPLAWGVLGRFAW